jgi:tetratricopeptide (TPR) repeat protein
MAGCLIALAGLQRLPAQMPGGDSQAEALQFFLEGSTHLMRGDYVDAEAMFRKSLAADPSHTASRYYLGRTLAELRRFNEAIPYAEAALAAEPGNYWYRQSLRLIHEYKGDFREAIRVQEQMVKLFPKKIAERLTLAELHRRSRNWEAAATQLQEAEKAAGPQEELSWLKYELFAEFGQQEQALAALGELAAMAPREMRYQELRYELLTSLGRSEAAQEVLRAMLAADTEQGFALATLAAQAIERRQAAQASQYLRGALSSPQVEPARKAALIERAAQGGYAADSLRAWIAFLARRHPEAPEMLLLQSRYASEGRDRRKDLRQVLEEEPARVELWSELLSLSFDAQDSEMLYADAGDAMGLFPNQSRFLYYFAYAALRTGKTDEAKRALLKIGQQPGASDEIRALALTEMGRYYTAQGEREMALAEWARATELNALNLKKNPQNVDCQFLQAELLSLQGQKAESLSWYEKAAASGNARMLEAWGDALYAQGKQADALRAWEKALQAGGRFSLEAKLR